MDKTHSVERCELLALVANLDVILYRSVQTSHRWRSAGGVVVALEDVAEARDLLAAVAWPEALAEAAQALQHRIDVFGQVLKDHDATNLHAGQRRVIAAVRDLRRAVMSWEVPAGK